jgi:diaminopimelate decarboxylase
MLNTTLERYVLETYSHLQQPFYLRDDSVLCDQWRIFTEGMPAGIVVHYAMMANDDPSILHWFSGQGCRIFVGSLPHLRVVEEIGFEPSRIVAGITNLTTRQLTSLGGRVGTILLGSETEFTAFNNIKGDTRALLRVNVAEPKKGGRRGIRCMGIDPSIVLRRWEEWRSCDNRLVGVHSYAGTNIQNLSILRRRAKKLFALANSLRDIQIVDIGGGFPLSINGTDKKGVLQAFWKTLITDTSKDVEIWVEPGRFLLAPTAFFVAAVTVVEEKCGQIHVGTDASVTMFPRRLMFGASDREHPLAIIHRERLDERNTWQSALIVGNTTYSKDILYKGPMPEVRVGDLVIFGNAGAYCRTAIPRFLGTEVPPEIILPIGLKESNSKGNDCNSSTDAFESYPLNMNKNHEEQMTMR